MMKRIYNLYVQKYVKDIEAPAIVVNNNSSNSSIKKSSIFDHSLAYLKQTIAPTSSSIYSELNHYLSSEQESEYNGTTQ